MQSLFALRFAGKVDYFAPTGDDKPPANKAVTRKYQQAQAMVLDSNYDALFTVESDMILPIDALEKLASLDVDMAFGLYVFRHGRYEWSASTKLTVNKNTSLSSNPDLARSLWGKVIEVAGVGFGCTLIRRHVLEAVKIDCRFHGDADWQFAQNVAYAGGQMVCDTTVICGHINKDTVLWPDPALENLVRIEPL